jgi:hypothetical protein
MYLKIRFAQAQLEAVHRIQRQIHRSTYCHQKTGTDIKLFRDSMLKTRDLKRYKLKADLPGHTDEVCGRQAC